MRDFDPTASEFISSGYLERSRPGGQMYDIGSIVTGGLGLLGGVMNSKAAGRASDQQAQSGRDSNALLKQQYDQTRADNAGVRFRGDAAGNRLSYLMGIGGPSGGSGMSGQGAPQQTRDQIRSGLLSKYSTAGSAAMPTYDPRNNYESGVGWANGVEIPNGYTQATPAGVDEAGLNAATDAAYGSQQQAQQQSAQAQANDPAYGSLSRNFSAGDMSSDPQYAQLQPLIDRAMQNSMKGPGTFEESPGYQFRMAEGLKATGNNQNAANGSYSGATLKALARFGQDTASQEYGNWQAQNNTNRNFQNQDRNFIAGQGQDAFNRFTGNQDRTYNRLAGIAGTGQTATNNVNSAGAAYAQNAGNTLQNIGNVQAGGTVAAANAYTNAAQNGFNNYQQNQQLQAYRDRTNSSLYAPPVNDGGYGVGQGSAYGGNRQGM